MLEEQSNYQSDYVEAYPQPPQSSADEARQTLQAAVSQVLSISEVQSVPETEQIVGRFFGELLVESYEVIDTLDPQLAALNVHAFLADDPDHDRYVITVVAGRHEPEPRPWWPNAVLFVLTVLSILFVGAQIQAGVDGRSLENLSDIRLWEGWPYALSLVLILGAHELGHYFAARYHDVSVTLPYFIPLPFGLFGTLGAFIQLREPMKNRQELFDVGVAGPLAGLVFAVPILLYGLATSNIEVIDSSETIIREGNSLFYAFAKIITFGKFVPDGNQDVFLNQFALAGWTGLFVTALNLIPVGQLDGGHVMYTLLGRRARQLFWPAIIAMAILTYFNSAWFLWTLLLFFFGRSYAVPLDDVTPLDVKRRILGVIALIIFVLTFIPNPIQIIEP